MLLFRANMHVLDKVEQTNTGSVGGWGCFRKTIEGLFDVINRLVRLKWEVKLKEVK